MKSVKQYIAHQFESSSIRTQEYTAFESLCKKELKKQCENVGFNLHAFKPNHFEWTAVLERDGKFIYVRLNDVRYWDWYNNILIRTMAHDKDWTGGINHKCSFDEIGKKATYLWERM